MMPVLVAAILLLGPPTVYFAVKSRDVRKFLAGAFFVSAGMQLYFYVAKVPVPLMGTDIVQTPAVSGVRGILHFVFFLVTFYFGFVRRPRTSVDPSGARSHGAGAPGARGPYGPTAGRRSGRR